MRSTRKPNNSADTRGNLPPIPTELAVAELAYADAQATFAKAAQRCADLGRHRNGVPIRSKGEIAAGNSALDDAQAALEGAKARRNRLRDEYQEEARAALAPTLAELQDKVSAAIEELVAHLCAAQSVQAEARKTGINLGHPLLNAAATLAGQAKMITATLAVTVHQRNR